MNKKDKKFREKDDIDKYVENIVGDDSKLQQALIEQLTVQQWVSVVLLCSAQSRLKRIIQFVLDYRDKLLASEEEQKNGVDQAFETDDAEILEKQK